MKFLRKKIYEDDAANKQNGQDAANNQNAGNSDAGDDDESTDSAKDSETEKSRQNIVDQIEGINSQMAQLIQTYKMKYKTVSDQLSQLILSANDVADNDVSSITEISNKFNTIEKQREDEKFQLQTKLHTMRVNIIQLRAKLGTLGDKGESLVKTVLDESVNAGDTKMKQLTDLLFDSYNNVDISYSFNEKECKRLARKIMEYINSNASANFDDVKKCIDKYFKNGVVNYTDKEFDVLMNSFHDQLDKTENKFKFLIEENND